LVISPGQGIIEQDVLVIFIGLVSQVGNRLAKELYGFGIVSPFNLDPALKLERIPMIRISFYAALADWASSTQLSSQSSRRMVNQNSKRCQGRVESGLRALGCLPDAGRSAKSEGNQPDLPAHQSENHEKYSPPVSAAIKSS
jgi:hypothetical protein